MWYILQYGPQVPKQVDGSFFSLELVLVNENTKEFAIAEDIFAPLTSFDYR